MSKKLLKLLIMVVSFIIGFVLVITISQYLKYNFLSNITNGLYSDNSIYFTVNKITAMDSVISEIYKDEVLFGEINNEFKTIYFIGNYKLPVKDGRFFNRQDFDNKKNYIVIGSKYNAGIKTINKKQYYTFNDVEFEVIGILGLDIPSPLDNMILFNYEYVKKYLDSKCMYVLSSDSDKKSLDITTDITVYNIPSTGINRVINSAWGINFVVIFIIGISVLSLIMLGFQYIRIRLEMIKVFIINGFDGIYTAVKLIKEQCMYILIPYFLGSIFSYELTDKYFRRINTIIEIIVFLLMLFAMNILLLTNYFNTEKIKERMLGNDGNN